MSLAGRAFVSVLLVCLAHHAAAAADDCVVARLLVPQAAPEPWEQDVWLAHVVDSVGHDLSEGHRAYHHYRVRAFHSVVTPGPGGGGTPAGGATPIAPGGSPGIARGSLPPHPACPVSPERSRKEPFRTDSNRGEERGLGAPAREDSAQELYADDLYVVEGVMFENSPQWPTYEIFVNGSAHGEWQYSRVYQNRDVPPSYDYRQIIVVYSNGFVRFKALGEDTSGLGDFKFGTSMVLGPYIYASQTQSPDDSLHPTIDSMHVWASQSTGLGIDLFGAFELNGTDLIASKWSVDPDSVGDYASAWEIRQCIEALDNVPLNELPSVGKVLGMAGLSSMYYSDTVFDSNVLYVSDSAGCAVDSLFPWELSPPDSPYTESAPMPIPYCGDVELAKTYDDTHNPTSPDVRIYDILEVEWHLEARRSGGDLLLEWLPIPGADSIFVFRQATAYFDPDMVSYTNRVAVLAGTATQYASSFAVGNPSTNAFYRLVVFSSRLGDLSRSPTVAEHDFNTGN
jgi:hypothetical protein